LAAAADARGLAWEDEKRAWEEANAARAKKGEDPLPLPKSLKQARPAPAYQAVLALEIPDVLEGLFDTTGTALAGLSREELRELLRFSQVPTELRSYGVWAARPKQKDAKELVWRTYPDFGYGPLDHKRQEFEFVHNVDQPTAHPDLMVIDDGALRFRHGDPDALWPDFERDAESFLLLKMSRPLCCSKLWTRLRDEKQRLIVVVSARDLQRQDIQINTRLSWEQCAEQTLAALAGNPTGLELSTSAAHVIVTFGSAGALWLETSGDADGGAHLLFDPERLEGEFERDLEGTAYGFQTSFTAAVAHHLMRNLCLAAEAGSQASPLRDPTVVRPALQEGIAAGIMARRDLLRLGHGPISEENPGTPFGGVARTIVKSPAGIAMAKVPQASCDKQGCQWSILGELEPSLVAEADPKAPLTDLGLLTARYGIDALSEVPVLNKGQLHAVDRADIESLRTLERLIQAYEETKVQKRPLCLGVFGPPGAGKSFGVKALAKAVLGPNVPFLEFNLSQFEDPKELIGAFHRVRDEVLKGITPVALWDEFDSKNYFWLQYLLAPMQDGTFQEGQVTHPLGKCIFVFAGGTADTFDTFGVRPPGRGGASNLRGRTPSMRSAQPGRAESLQKEVDRYTEYKLRKGPDFVSRLHGFLNVLGPNQRVGTSCVDNSWPIRRALLMRGFVPALGEKAELDVDPGLLYALLMVPEYKFGARSFERIVTTILGDGKQGHLNRSDLPPQPLLERETSAEDLYRLLEERDAYSHQVDIDALAGEINKRFCAKYKSGQPVFDLLDSDLKASNRGAARRLPAHLAMIGFAIRSASGDEDLSWKRPVEEAIATHLERLARAEHLGWCAERTASGWTYDKVRDDKQKRHPLLVPWKELPLDQRNKDHDIVTWIPDILQTTGYEAVQVLARRTKSSVPSCHR
jgi:hypothetical protein